MIPIIYFAILYKNISNSMATTCPIKSSITDGQSSSEESFCVSISARHWKGQKRQSNRTTGFPNQYINSVNVLFFFFNILR